MATRVLSHIRKASLTNSLFQTGFGSRSSTSTTNILSSSSPGSWGSSCIRVPLPALTEEVSLMTRDMSRLFPSVGFSPRSLSSTPSLGSIVVQPLRQSSMGISSSRSFSTSGMVPNMKLGFNKQRRNRGEIKGTTQNHISFGKYGLEALEPAWLTTKQITAGQLAIKRNMKGGKLFLRVFPHKPVSLKPAETRMGRGKGNVAFWVARVRAGRVLFEIDGVPESVARRAITVAASKMPIKTRFVKSLG